MYVLVCMVSQPQQTDSSSITPYNELAAVS